MASAADNPRNLHTPDGFVKAIDKAGRITHVPPHFVGRWGYRPYTPRPPRPTLPADTPATGSGDGAKDAPTSKGGASNTNTNTTTVTEES